MDAQEVMHMTDYSKITALYSRLSVGDEDRDGGESNSIQNQKIFLENYARGQHLTNIRHYIDDDESGRFFDRSAYSRMMDDVENGKIGVCIMKDLTRWGRDYLQVGNAMEIFRRNNVLYLRFWQAGRKVLDVDQAGSAQTTAFTLDEVGVLQFPEQLDRLVLGAAEGFLHFPDGVDDIHPTLLVQPAVLCR